jgi:predicted GTPase
MFIMSVTLATFQLAMLSLNVALAEKSAFALLDTALTSQAPIAPYVVVAVAGDAIQLVTAVTTFVFVIDVTAPANEAERKISTNAPKAVASHVLAADPGGDPTRTSH